MDEAVDDDATGVTAADGMHVIHKQREYSLKPSNSSLLESHESDQNEGSSHLFTDILDGKNLDRMGSSEQASVSPHCMNNSGIMVEELTFTNYSGENLAIVGTSDNRDRVQSWKKHLHQKATGSGSAGSNGDAANRDRNWEAKSVWEDTGHLFYSGFLDQNQKPSGENYQELLDNFPGNDNKSMLSNAFSSGVTRTKIVSKSGYSEYFIKNTLKGKGIIYKGPLDRGFGDESGNQSYSRSTSTGILSSNTPLSSTRDVVMPISNVFPEVWSSISTFPNPDGVLLREWLRAGQNKANKMENLRIFRQIVKLVDFSHSQGIALKELRPSYFKLLPSNRVIYLGSSVHLSDNVLDHDVPRSEHDQIGKRPLKKNLLPFDHHFAKKQKFGDNMLHSGRLPHSSSSFDFKTASVDISRVDSFLGPNSGSGSSENQNIKVDFKSQSRSSVPQAPDMSPPILTSVNFMSEEKWYSSPEQHTERRLAFSSNIYSLGVLLFELLSSFDSRRSHEAAMLDLRHRILPPEFLSENPKEAGFCLWLLHPESSSRPTAREILQFEVICSIQELAGDELVSSIEEEDAESELLLHFLLSLKEKKQRDASNLVEEIRFIEADVQEVEKRQTRELPACTSLAEESLATKRNRLLRRGHVSSDFRPRLPLLCDEKMTKNIRQLESAYFSMRSNIQLPRKDMTTRGDKGLLRIRENWSLGKDRGICKTTDCLGGFFTDLCKYACYSNFKVRGVLRNGDMANSANVICSLSFDRDEDYLAAGGVSKKIKIFDFHALFDDSVDIHYPVVEMSNKSKLSCICWNSYIRNYLASTDYDGAVKLWDAATGQGFSEFVEHDERAWSVDFSRLDPTKFASGSDDHLVKLWSINERNSLCTIRNNANVCSVQFSAQSTYLLAFSTADYKTYCYDLRNISTPWCILAGHEKAVSYAKFLDNETLVSASTDNTLKIWDLNKTNSNGLSRDACVLTLRGHTNEKNFVGLSVADGYITCGSETNEVFAYYRSLPMPITSLKFGSIDPISGKETDDDNEQFVSSVCWRRKSNMVIAANSSGCIKLLELV
ncbi:protein SPA1-RELATED 2 isoform X1 [Coffea eugenioides]|uniref:Protein SPA1-RELATED 2-like isoform X2 n=1 Tax=Coffea arabica TaxID=13443 RepID=A0A6P6TR77_COFAR|nr:protein SPA1-RELATED 2-like isoform X2 [Coffea arabica]XP_027080126.1 protein SPA1-RELATED 2-like isoform X2 [Coffea arabica]XP_027080127.1 protein SPA1-RELATED 2-like isoform X2 [Coffea arabica]XP_027080128.1 protein SPA1-RELATED 2-like isoform X2 [Coffea arabica]XP_027183412.1 protein SPA1-RELATED 2 isoform X1 [Coffea eugenioides]XP_027183413.1 protein SPA1-RELATED 2 isoform X1 [Coffea eugenioides]XP_027183414.1 protein SPA1-RELATED 2 isoform X1 [Coffea eugenioides]XP_027183415.1 protei